MRVYWLPGYENSAPRLELHCNRCRNVKKASWHCNSCANFDLCEDCKLLEKHSHQMQFIAAADEAEENERMDLALRHMAQCLNLPCKRRLCRSLRQELLHYVNCKSCFRCNDFTWTVLQHARRCNLNNCTAPFCRAARESGCLEISQREDVECLK